jgi:Ca2+-binding RTX toxin-like protein
MQLHSSSAVTNGLQSVKITNSFYSLINGDDSLLKATDAISMAIDAIELVIGSSRKLGMFGVINSAAALQARLQTVYSDLTSDDPGAKVELSTYINIVGDLLGLTGNLLTIAGIQGKVAGSLLLIASAAVGYLGNLVQTAEAKDKDDLEHIVKQIDKELASNIVFSSSLDGFDSPQMTMYNLNKLMTDDQKIQISYKSNEIGQFDEIVLTSFDSTSGDPAFEIITESKMVDVQDAINYAIQYNIQGVIVNTISKTNISSATKYKDEIILSDFSDVVHGNGGDDNILGNGGGDRIYGDDGNDTLAGDDGADFIYGGADNDIIKGGTGDDHLFGDDGVDTYVFDLGDGKDTIHTYDGIDKILLNYSVKSIYRGNGESQFDLIIEYGENNNSITIENFYLGSGLSMIDELKTLNGTLDKNDLIRSGLSLTKTGDGEMKGLNGYENSFQGYSGHHKVYGGNLKDNINLTGGDIGDIVYAGSGNDDIRLGSGNDYVYGGDGDDSYYLSGGHDIILDAQINGKLNYDKIHINKAISLDMIKVQKSGSDMVISYGPNDSIVIKDWYASNGYKIESLSYGAAMIALTWQQLEEMAKKEEEATPDYKANKLFDDLFKDDFFKGMKDLTSSEGFVVQPIRRDPLVLDLDGDGIHTTGVNMNVHFDHDGDGYKEQTGWLSGSDGFVVLDRNGNGVIDNGTELFGTNTSLSDGTTASDGYDALAEYDLNQDGKIDSSDSIYNDIKIWTDVNYNGVSEQEELFSLKDLGIKSISVQGKNNGTITDTQNIVVKDGTFEYNNGTTGVSNSLEFNTNKFSVDADGKIIIDSRLSGINDISAMGYSRSLKESATVNSTLGDLLVEFQNSDSRTDKTNLLDKIIVQWAKTSEFKDFYERIAAYQYPQSSPKPTDVLYESDGVKSKFDYIAIAEIFSGKTLWQINNTNVYTVIRDNPTLKIFYEDLKKYVYSSLIDGTQFKSYKLALMDSDGELNDLNELKAIFENDLTHNGIKAFEKIFDFTFLYGDSLLNIGFKRDEYLIEILSKFEWPLDSISLLKNMGITYINGTGWSNTDTQIVNEYLIGEEHSKINKFVLGGNGSDTISVSGEGAIIYTRDGDDMITAGSGSQEIHGGSGNDVIDSGYGSDVIFGDDGDDVIGNSQQDRNGEIPGYSPPIGTTFYGNNVTGGKGNDVIYGTTFGDIYNYQAGDGNDVVYEANFKSSSNLYTDKLVFGNLITSNNTILIAAGLDLIIKFKDSSGSITFKNHFSGQYSQIDQILFSDETVWSADEIADRAFQINGTDANDIIYGNDSSSYSDVIYGGSGDDIIYGYRGADKLYGESGNDTLKGGSDNDYLDGGEGNDIIDGGYGSDTLIGGDGNDTIGNGTEDVTGISPIPPGSTFLGNIITGGRGDDTIYGSNFGDIFNFNIGDGKDIIYEQSRTNDSEFYTDKIIFGDQVNTSNIILNSSGSDVVITFQGSSDSITLKNQLSGGTAQIDRFVFKDGTIWNQSEINNRALTKTGTEASDTLTGNNATTYGDIIYGGAGNDIISGLGGADRLYGEAGNDNIKGGNENDYLDGGEGDDTLDGGNGSDVLIGGSGNDILGNSSEDKNPASTFPLGTTFFGNNYTGGTGDDTIYGSWYGDIYNFNIGDGKDTVIETAISASADEKYADRIVFGQGVLLSDLSIEYVSNALVIHVGSQGDQIKINAWNNATSRVERLELFDGTILDQTQITNLPTYGAAAQMNQSLDGLVQAMSSFGVDNTTESSGMSYVEYQQVLLAAPQ